MCWTLVLLGFVLLLTGCGSSDEESETDPAENDSAIESEEKADDQEEEGEVLDSSTDSGETATDDSDNTSSDETSDENSSNNSESEDQNDPLAEFSSQEIEYARVWLQLGPNQEIDELNVHRIPAGELINPNDETSAAYPEDVIQLAGSRLVDGSVTYSSNGDGTINVYKVPLRWDSGDPNVDENYMKEYTQEIIDDTEEVYVEPGDDEEVKRLIGIMNIH